MTIDIEFGKLLYWEEGDSDYCIINDQKPNTIMVILFEDVNSELFDKFINIIKNYIMEYSNKGTIEHTLSKALCDQYFTFEDEDDFNRFILENA